MHLYTLCIHLFFSCIMLFSCPVSRLRQNKTCAYCEPLMFSGLGVGLWRARAHLLSQPFLSVFLEFLDTRLPVPTQPILILPPGKRKIYFRSICANAAVSDVFSTGSTEILFPLLILTAQMQRSQIYFQLVVQKYYFHC